MSLLRTLRNKYAVEKAADQPLDDYFIMLAGSVLAGIGQIGSPGLANKAKAVLKECKSILSKSSNKAVTSSIKYLRVDEYGVDSPVVDKAELALRKAGLNDAEIDLVNILGETPSKNDVMRLLDKYSANDTTKKLWDKTLDLCVQLDKEEG